ncbi:MAG: hypothetical protein QXF85_00390, partial [Candidatus Micrarchaeaceae archaeon]
NTPLPSLLPQTSAVNKTVNFLAMANPFDLTESPKQCKNHSYPPPLAPYYLPQARHSITP